MNLKKIILAFALTIGIFTCMESNQQIQQRQLKEQQKQLQGKEQEQERQLQQELQQIQKDLENKPCKEILYTLSLGGIISGVTLWNLKRLNLVITRQFKDLELKKAITEVLKLKELTKGNEGELNNELHYIVVTSIDQNRTKVTWRGDGRVTFYDHSGINKQQVTLTFKNNEGNLITEEESTNIQKLINAILKLREILSKSDLDPNEKKFTLSRIRDLFNTNCYDILEKKPLKANEYIEGLERMLEKNKDIIQLVLRAQDEIEKAIEESGSDILKNSDLYLGFSDFYSDFFLGRGLLFNYTSCEGLLNYTSCKGLLNYKTCKGKGHLSPKICLDFSPNNKSCKDSNHPGSKICSCFQGILTAGLDPKKAQLIQKTLNKTCEIISELSDTVLDGNTPLTGKWGALMKQIYQYFETMR